MDSTIYFEVFVLIDILVSDVFCDDIVGHVFRTAAEIASCPKVSSPKLLLQVTVCAPRRYSVMPEAYLARTR
jgi:hypothetical protein